MHAVIEGFGEKIGDIPTTASIRTVKILSERKERKQFTWSNLVNQFYGRNDGNWSKVPRSRMKQR